MGMGILSSITNSSGGGLSAKGQATLVNGTVTVLTAAVKSSSTILLSILGPGTEPGLLMIGTIVDGVSFVINSSSDTDGSSVSWGIA